MYVYIRMYTLDILDESPSLSHMDPTRDAEGVGPEERIKDPQDSQMCGAMETQIVGPPGASSVPPTIWFSSHLSQMDAQLAALQNIADSLKDFSNSRMVHKNNVLLTDQIIVVQIYNICNV